MSERSENEASASESSVGAKRKRSETIGAKASHTKISLGRCVARCVVGSRRISQSSGRRYPATADLCFSSLSDRKGLGTYLGVDMTRHDIMT